jgi:ribosomal protein S27E
MTTPTPSQDDRTPGPHVVKVQCPTCGHHGIVSGHLQPMRQVTCSRCAQSAILADLRNARAA